MVSNWAWWGLGWLFMPRMTIGILLYTVFELHTLGLTLAIIGGFMDITGGTYSVKKY